MDLQCAKNPMQCNLKISGIALALTELGLFGAGATVPYLFMEQLREFDPICYYWGCFTVLTGIWEASFVKNYTLVGDQGHYLLVTATRVWNTKYSLSYLLPWKLPVVFYGEYGAYADREYLSLKDNWSRLIESTHAFFCATFSFFTLILYTLEHNERAEVTWAIAMGTQLMNSILYMGQYIIQVHELSSPNHDSDEFPSGRALCKRPFMYINAPWTLMPIYAIVRLLC